MRVAIIGGTGFVGSYIVDALLEQGHQPRLLVRSDRPQPDQREIVEGDVGNETALKTLAHGCDAIIYNIGILREFPDKGITFQALQYEGAKRAIDAAKYAGVKRFLLMSANGVKPEGTAYQRTKFQAEEALKASSLEWTILRPSVIFGDPRKRMEFATQLYRDIVASPMPAPLFHPGVLPFGAGTMQMSPVHVQDVAAVFVDCLTRAESIGKTYRLGGPDDLSWKEILKTIAKATNKSSFGLPVPAWAVKMVARIFERLEDFPITRDQITMLMEGNTCDSSALFQELGITPKPFTPENLDYLRS